MILLVMYIMSCDLYYGVSFPVRVCSFVSFSVLQMNTIVLTETTSSHNSSGAKLSHGALCKLNTIKAL